MGGKNKVRVAIIGVGNCASSLVQGVEYYKSAPADAFVPGLMHVNLGGYHVGDIEFSAAIDIDKNKVGRDVSEAIFTKPNNTYKFSDVPSLGVRVARGMTHDGLGKYLSEIIEKAPGSTDDIVELLKDTGTGGTSSRSSKPGAALSTASRSSSPASSTGSSASRRRACRLWETTSSHRSVRPSCTAC